MKTLILSTIAFLFTIGIQAQNVNKKVETTTTVKTKKDETGTHRTIKKATTSEVQKVELGDEKANSKNIPMTDSPVMVTKTTTVTNPDGTTRTVDIDRSAYYEFGGSKYKLSLDASGYVMTLGTEKPVLLRKTSTNSYIYRSDAKTAIGYFDTSGNLIIEVYDDKSDQVILEKFSVLKQD